MFLRQGCRLRTCCVSAADVARAQLLEAAMADPARVTAAEGRVEYTALLRAAQCAADAGVFNAKHKATLEARAACLRGAQRNSAQLRPCVF
jgi:hypothetical protein